MARPSDDSKNIDLRAAIADVAGQFRGLDTGEHPAAWPPWPRRLLLLAVVVVITVALWFVWIRHVNEDLEAARASEVTLRKDYQAKLQKAVSLDELKTQRAQIQQYVSVLEKQLPNKAEMDALLSDINQAGLGRSLQFDLFKPGSLIVRDYYAELPIALKVTGKYHDIGEFTADIADLSRIVTLNNLSVQLPSGKNAAAAEPTESLVLQATAKTFRYLDDDEIAAQRKAAQSKKGGKR